MRRQKWFDFCLLTPEPTMHAAAKPTPTAPQERLAPVRIRRNRLSPGILLFVGLGLFRCHRRQRPEQAIGLTVRSGREKQRGRGTTAAIIAKPQRPQPINEHRAAIRVQHVPQKAAGDGIEGGNIVAPEVANQDGVAELAETRRGPDNSPGSVKPIAVLEPLQQPAVAVKYVHKAIAWLAWPDRIVP